MSEDRLAAQTRTRTQTQMHSSAEAKMSLDEVVDSLNDKVNENVAQDEDLNGAVVGKDGSAWIKGALIGTGSFGSVFLGMDASSGLLMAVRQIELPDGSNTARLASALSDKIAMIRGLKHNNLVDITDWSLSDSHLNLFVEYVAGGSISDLLSKYGAFEESLTRNFTRQVLCGLEYLHNASMFHGNIKPSNVLVDNKGIVKLSDVGLDDVRSVLAPEYRGRPSWRKRICWCVPEVLSGTVPSQKTDTWSVGYLVAEMLRAAQLYPNDHSSAPEQDASLAALGPKIGDISELARDFISQAWTEIAEMRPTAGQLLRHPWLSDVRVAVDPEIIGEKETLASEMK